jgi:hypothetical protein
VHPAYRPAARAAEPLKSLSNRGRAQGAGAGAPAAGGRADIGCGPGDHAQLDSAANRAQARSLGSNARSAPRGRARARLACTAAVPGPRCGGAGRWRRRLEGIVGFRRAHHLGVAVARRRRIVGAAATWIACGVLVVCAGRFLGSPAPADDRFTLYLLGGSTAAGYPYAPRADVGQIARLLAGDRVGGRRVHVVNLAGPGKAMRVVRRDAHELVARRRHGPALAFVYIGNNEFLRYDQRHDLSRSERRLCDAPCVTPDDRARVHGRYAEDLAAAVAELQEAGIAVVLSTVAVNLADWEPNRSVLADPRHAPAIEEAFRDAEAAERAGDEAAAFAAYRRVLALEPHFALAAHRAGPGWRRRGAADEAARLLQVACDRDGNPLRATSPLNAIVRDVAARRRVPLIDAAVRFAAASPSGVTGFESMWDNCHPTLGGYALLAADLVAVLDSLYGAERRGLDTAAIASALNIDAAFEQQVLATEGQYCYSAATLTFEPRARLARARTYLEAADALGPDAGVVASLAILEALAGDVDRSLAHWRRAHELDATIAAERMRNRYVMQVLARAGMTDLARAAAPEP